MCCTRLTHFELGGCFRTAFKWAVTRIPSLLAPQSWPDASDNLVVLDRLEVVDSSITLHSVIGFIMANATVSRLGAQDGSVGSESAIRALFLKVFSGEILTAFKEANVALERSMVRSISSGKSAQFPATWKATAAYHTPGTEIVGQVIKGNERVINIDGLLLADAFIANIDEAMNHYDVRAPYKAELGYSLSNKMDRHLLQLMVIAARAAATVSGGFGGTELVNADYDTSPNTLVTGFFDAATALDEKDVPDDGQRNGFLLPDSYHMLVQSERAVNRDWNGQDDNGSYKKGKILELCGVAIVKSNHVPNTDLSAGANALQQNDYFENFANTIGVISHKTAVGTVKLLDLAFEMEYDIRRQGTLMVAKYACGHGILRPECAVELKVA